jgi:hypothetical protein
MCIRHLLSLCLAAIALFAIGCAGTQMPNWYHPGPAGYQRYNALQFDPYPSDDVGPSTGTRPPEYSREIPEAERAQKFTPPPAGVRPLQMPSFSMPSIAPPPTAGAPVGAPAPVFPSARAPY